jgi:phosphoglycolate phosphatase-like HAD superfamily hydrolase
MQALVMDFDGVVSDSVRESFSVALRAYFDLCPESPLGARDAGSLYPPFLEAMPLGNRAEDYGTVIAAIESGVELTDQSDYDAYRSTREAGWLERYQRRFYEVRAAMVENDPEGWRALMRPYDPFLEILHRRAGTVTYAIATSKDRRSVEALMQAYGIADLVPAERILDKETGTRKSVHLSRLRDGLGLDYPAMTFIDDKVNHLDAVAPLGVRCALASWGYNGPREHDLAAGRGYLVCTLEDAERVLFG